jgi:hypothetical protein
MINFFKENKPFLICLFIFICITLPKMINHYPCCDEAQNFMVSYFMNFSNWFELCSFHGHTILWYLIMMPFSKLNIGYPYSILILNYLFILAALIIMWRKAPFDNIYKVIITFSYMMINYYAIVARCYSIGVLGLFIIAGLYKEQVKRPILYALVLGLTANTSAMAAITVIPFSLIFLYNMYSFRKDINKYKIFFSITILMLFATLFLFPFIKTSNYRYSEEEMLFFISSLKSFFMPYKASFIFILSYFFVIFYILFNKKEFKPKFFLITSSLIFWCFMLFVYKCFPYHRFFFFIFIILAMWIQNYSEKYNKISLIFVIAFIVILYTPYDISAWVGQKNTFEFGKTLKKTPSMYNDKIIVIPDYYIRYEIAPFLLLNNPKTKIFACEHFYNYAFNDAVDCEYKQNVSELVKQTDKDVYLFSNKIINEYKLIKSENNINIYKLN